MTELEATIAAVERGVAAAHQSGREPSVVRVGQRLWERATWGWVTPPIAKGLRVEFAADPEAEPVVE